MDSSRPYNSERAERCIETATAEHLPHPAYSPDLTPSDFFLFGYIKGKLSDYNCQSREYLLNAITEMCTGVGREVLLSVFESWVNRPKWVINHEWKYYNKQRKSKRHFFKIGRENGRIRTSGTPYIISSCPPSDNVSGRSVRVSLII
jgi:hypothetical protein